MPTIENLREKFLRKIEELFRLDQPDLDFGFYRVMHAKHREIKKFIEHDLLSTIAEALDYFDESDNDDLEMQLKDAIETAKAYGAPDPDQAPTVVQIRDQIKNLRNREDTKMDVYEHLYRFFERYYDRGDFLSRRYYTRETADLASPFAIPYNGEEVKLHWANSDQYYIKSTDYFSNFSFDLKKSNDLRESADGLSGLEGDDSAFKVLFRIVSATEGEHGDIKSTDDQKRYFILHHAKPIEITAEEELCINFEYRSDEQRSGTTNRWQKSRNSEAVSKVLSELSKLATKTAQYTSRIAEYSRILRTQISDDSNVERTILDKYIDTFTSRNTRDYFIHKDLGTFLRRELDFYIKNEVLHLDSIDEFDDSHTIRQVVKIRVIRKISLKIINFLAQLENFQKKLWLKKKFVTETNYLITLDRIPSELYPEIAINSNQTNEVCTS